jgi:hypothetical protein
VPINVIRITLIEEAGIRTAAITGDKFALTAMDMPITLYKRE